MLRLWSDRIALAVSPTAFSIARYARTMTGWQLLRKQAGEATTEAAADNAFPVLEALKALNPADWSNASIDVIVSNAMVHASAIAWDPMLLSAAEERQYAAARMREIYGPLADEWLIVLDRPRYGQSRLAFGISRQLLSELKTVLHPLNLSLHSIKPQYQLALTYWAHHLRESQFRFIQLDHESIATGLIRRHRLQQLRTDRLHATDITSQLEAILQRESLLSEKAAQEIPVYLYYPAGIASHSGDLNARYKRLTAPTDITNTPKHFLALNNFR